MRTLQMRVRAKNPKIERRASGEPRSEEPISPEDTMPSVSLYEQLEQTDEPEILDEARAELEAALWTDIPPPRADEAKTRKA
ncbi:MAG: hypothetical protein AAFV29_08085, partial [Myxococcota bacterium]